MSEVYASCVDRLLINLARHFQFIAEGSPIPGAWEYQVRKLAEMDAVTRESEAIILATLGDANEALQGMLEDAIREGLKDAEPVMRKAAEKGLTLGEGFLPPNIAPRQMQAFRAYYAQSADKLNLVNTVMLESTQEAYAATVADIAAKISTTQGILNTATGQIITGVESFNVVQRNAVRQMVDNGLTGFIDHGGHHWSPEAYVAMDMRTTMTNTAREAVSERMESYGCELYQVSWHDGARPLCYPWQGKVISTNGWTGEVEDGEGNKVQVHSESEIESFRYGGGLFGVNCGHYQIPFFPGFSRSRPPRQNEEENAKEYAESQQQRALERKVREEKRELEVLKAQGATKEEIDAQKKRVRGANADLTEFCDKTGRARQPGRTLTPINATFPDGYQQTRAAGELSKGKIVDVTDEYTANRAARSSIKLEEGFDPGSRPDEYNMANLLSTKFGGEITALAERNPAGTKNPDFSWNGKLWELKTPESPNGVDGLVHTAVKQIERNSGGIIVDARKIEADHNELATTVFHRVRRSARDSADIILIEEGDQAKVFRYTKR